MHFSKSVNIGKGLHLTEVEGLVQAAAPARAADHRQRGVRLPGSPELQVARLMAKGLQTVQ